MVGITRAAPLQAPDPPGRLTYQGHLMDAAGEAVPDGNYAMNFSLYDAPTGGNLLWGPELHTVAVDDGYFVALLGRDDAIGADNLTANTYLEIEVAGETMTPRTALTSVAFALVAQEAISCTGVIGGDAWLIGGNSDPSSPELGTTNAQTMTLIVNDEARMTIGTRGQTALGSNVVASADYATVGGGQNNTASGTYAIVAGGGTNLASGTYAIVTGGAMNQASGDKSAIGGGQGNDASGMYAVIPGGYNNIASGNYSFAAGVKAQANHAGAFVWSDSLLDESVASTAPNQFIVRASGGVTMYTSSGGASGATLPAGSGSWASLSDRNAKIEINPTDNDAILAALAALNLSEWRYAASPNVMHIGPMAQDFYATFGYGDNDRYISSVDADGVALAAIQALLARVEALEARVAELETINEH